MGGCNNSIYIWCALKCEPKSPKSVEHFEEGGIFDVIPMYEFSSVGDALDMALSRWFPGIEEVWI